MTVRGGSTVRVTVKGAPALHRALRPLLEPEFSRIVDASNKKGAQSLAKDVKAEARPVSKRMARATRVKRAKTGKPDWVVGGRRRVAFFWHFVINGTKAHGPRSAPFLRWQAHGRTILARRVRGVKPNPIIDRVVSRREDAVAKSIESDIVQRTGL